MSLVIAAISKDNDIIVCGEGRTVDSITNEVYKEDTRKVFKYNASLIVACAGDDTKTVPLKVHLLKLCINYYKKWDIESIYKEALKYEKENHKVENGSLQFLAAGYDDNNNPHLYVISADENTCVNLDFASQRTVSIGDMECKLNFDKDNDNLEEIELKITKTIKERAKINPLINGTITANEKIFNS
mgnify:CR=1 FL=1